MEEVKNTTEQKPKFSEWCRKNPLELFASFWCAVLTVIVLLQVLFRYALHFPLDWAEELAMVLFQWITFIGAGIAVRHGLHFHLDLITSGFSKRWQKVTDLMASAAVLIVAQCAGSVQLQQGGRSALHTHHGLAAATGVQAALLARHGLPGMHEFLTGKFGFYNAYEGGGYNLDVLTDGLGKRFEITQVSVKQYPSGRVTHPAIEAAICLRNEERIDPADIVEVVVLYTKGGFNMTCEPAEERRVPRSVQHAKFSLYYNVACALARGHVDLEDFMPEAIADETVRNLALKVNVVVDPDIKGVIPPGIVTVRLKDGRELRREVTHLKGTPENPMTFDDCAAKFRRCQAFAAKPLDSTKTEAAIDLVEHLEVGGDVRELVGLLT